MTEIGILICFHLLDYCFHTICSDTYIVSVCAFLQIRNVYRRVFTVAICIQCSTYNLLSLLMLMVGYSASSLLSDQREWIKSFCFVWFCNFFFSFFFSYRYLHLHFLCCVFFPSFYLKRFDFMLEEKRRRWERKTSNKFSEMSSFFFGTVCCASICLHCWT